MRRRCWPASDALAEDADRAPKRAAVDQRGDHLASAADLASRFELFCAGPPHPVEYGGRIPRCACDRCDRWAAFLGGGVNGQPQYEVISADLIDGLASWVRSERSRSDARPFVLLEVGAGDGRLSLHLRRSLAHSDVRVVPTDSCARGLRPHPEAELVRMDYAEAIGEFQPQLVLCSWMPLGHDWTAAIRACSSVRAYALVGETDDGCCGRPWLTWGFLAPGDPDVEEVDVSSTSSSSSECSADSDGDGALGWPGGGGGEDDSTACAGPVERERWRRVYAFEPERTPWGAAGWEREELRELSRRQLCRTDTPWCSTRHSKTVVFRRKPAAASTSSPLGAHTVTVLTEHVSMTH